jgi:hypothetical protein
MIDFLSFINGCRNRFAGEGDQVWEHQENLFSGFKCEKTSGHYLGLIVMSH